MPRRSALVVGAVLASLASLAAGYWLGRRRSCTPSSSSSSSALSTKADIELDHVDVSNRVLRKAENVINKRTTRVTVVIERCTDVHNYTAVLRTAEALGVQNVYLIAPPLKPEEQQPDRQQAAGGEAPDLVPFTPEVHSLSKNNVEQKKKRKDAWKDDLEEAEKHIAYARDACKWIDVRNFRNTADCVRALKEEGHNIWVTDLSQAASVLDAPAGAGLPLKLAIVFGTESTGCTAEMLKAADKRVYLPLNGFADSLNLSVACAMVVQRLLFIDPTIEGAISEEEKMDLRRRWYPKIARDENQLKEYMNMIETKQFIKPFNDARRCDKHREGWVMKKVIDKANAVHDGLK